ncbi:helix-turn-helix domain-containing protein [Sandaracinobacteroides saxicola]|uniref:Helix-turn-helix transcriptional regulator n=1 Tax=Sandaracinobacteroides saxicola TaxID=2759707 RepID=A0A7G5IFH7_9SPHN|nr:helix-turn-helix transcriptional regulator [Sandaracinobacteroides saxicola]QMW22119.1 helix-turn-helix transcriptional regulator [Sandaracinobacteroides saxicola]
MSLPDIAVKVALLTATQRTYLQLVAQGYTSKQISQIVGGSHHTINVEIGIAMRLLGASSRKQAAAMVKDCDVSTSYEQSYEAKIIANPATSLINHNKSGGVKALSQLPLPVSTVKTPINNMTAAQRIMWILVLAAAIALLLGGLTSGVTALIVSIQHWL